MASGDRILPVSARASLVDQAWVVRRYTLREALGRPYRLEAELRATRSEPWFGADDLVGQEIELVVERGDEERVVTGVVRKVTALPDDGHRQRVRVTAVPVMGLADRARRCRIFQERTVVEIVTEVFQELFERFGRSLDASRLVNVYPRRDYRVQYDEDDLAFAHRILEEEGITYLFEPSPDGEVLVLVDDPAGFRAVERAAAGGHRIRFSAHDEHVAPEETIRSFEWSRTLRAGRVRHEQWAWKDGPTMLHSVVSDPDRGDPWELFEIAEHDLLAPPEQDVVEQEPDTTGRSARAALEAELVGSYRGVASSNVVALRPGVVFELGDHPDPELDRAFTVVKIEHRADLADVESFSGGEREDEQYESTLTCIPAEVPFRRRPRPKPRIHGIQTAVVVGHQEIDPDARGRIRVRMGWDRDPSLRTDPQEASCWMRVAMPWAGEGFGAFFLPRVGMEVLIAYLDGDPDRPLCMGCVHNGTASPPYTLPLHKTRSTIRTRSSPGGDGFNELRFEDEAGAEEVFIHAQRDMKTEVRRNDSTSVGYDQSCTVGHDQTLTVRNDRETLVEGHDRATTKKDRLRRVEGGEEVHIVGGQRVQVGGGPAAGAAQPPTAPGAELVVIGTYRVYARDKLVLQVGNDTMLEMTPAGITLKAPALFHLDISGAITTMTPQLLMSKVPVAQVFAQGSQLILAAEATLSSTARVRSQSGQSHVTVDPVMVRAEGPTAVFEGTTLATLQSTGMVSVTGGNTLINGDACVDVTAPTAITLSGGGNTVTIAGGVVGLGD